MKTAIVYYSKHHGNTKKLLDAIKSASSDDITLIDVTSTPMQSLKIMTQLVFHQVFTIQNLKKES